MRLLPELDKSGSFIGMSGLAAMLFVYAASVLVFAWWIVALLIVVWMAIFVQACRWFVDRPRTVFALPFLALLVWAVTVGVVAATQA